MLSGFDADLLILYADTSLFSPTSFRGLGNRHRLREANLMLLSAVADRPYPYDPVAFALSLPPRPTITSIAHVEQPRLSLARFGQQLLKGHTRRADIDRIKLPAKRFDV